MTIFSQTIGFKRSQKSAKNSLNKFIGQRIIFFKFYVSTFDECEAENNQNSEDARSGHFVVKFQSEWKSSPNSSTNSASVVVEMTR